jgi:hypothetical protein
MEMVIRGREKRQGNWILWSDVKKGVAVFDS